MQCDEGATTVCARHVVLAARTLAAFLVWNLLAWPVLPAWSGVVAEIVEFL